MGLLDYLLQHPVIFVGAVVILVFIWAYLDTRKENQTDLKIEVLSYLAIPIMVYNPKPSELERMLYAKPYLQEKYEVKVTTKFTPVGGVKIKSLLLHVGDGSPYEANQLPVAVIGQQSTYQIDFSVPKRLLGETPQESYIELHSNDWGWRSNSFTIKG